MTALQDQLDQMTANTRRLVQPERLVPSEKAIAELFASRIHDNFLPVGAIAPSFTLNDGLGRIVRSDDLRPSAPSS